MQNMMINGFVFAQNVKGNFYVMSKGVKRLKQLYEKKEKVTFKTESIEITGIIEDVRHFSQMSGFYKDQLELSIKTDEKIIVKLIIDIEGM